MTASDYAAACEILTIALHAIARQAPAAVICRAEVSDLETPPIQIHAVRTRQAGSRRFVTMHVLVPGDWPVSLPAAGRVGWCGDCGSWRSHWPPCRC